MSFVDDLLAALSSYHGGYRLMRRRMRGDTRPLLPPRFRDTSKMTLDVTLSRLKKRGLVKNDKGMWGITAKGLEYLSLRLVPSRYRVGRGAANRPKNMIIAFDIPEKLRRKRDLIRDILKNLGFVMLQKSLWFGPAPLPKEFIVSLKEHKLLDYLKFFKAEEWDVV